MVNKEYEALRAKATPIAAKARAGEKLTDEEKATLVSLMKMKRDMYALKPKFARISYDVRDLVEENMTYDKSYKIRLRNAVKRLIVSIVGPDVEYAKANKKTVLIWGDAAKAARVEAKEERAAQKAKDEVARKKKAAKRLKDAAAKRDVQAKKDAEKAKKLGLDAVDTSDEVETTPAPAKKSAKPVKA